MTSAQHPLTTADTSTIALLTLVATLKDHAFTRLAETAAAAPAAAERHMFSRWAARAVDDRDEVLRHLTKLRQDGAGTEEQISQTVQAILEEFENRITPTSWWERLLTIYVAIGVWDDLCRLAVARVDETTGELVGRVLDDTSSNEMAVENLSAACTQDPALESRLALWGRRVVGESLRGIAGLLKDLPYLAGLVQPVKEDEADQTKPNQPDIARVMNTLTGEHTRRMAKLRLAA